jgi:hypothetical protein
VGLAEKLRMIRNDGEIEWPAQLNLAGGPALLVEGLHANCLTFREAVGVRRPAPRPLPPGVEREDGVDVGVSEEGLPEGLVVRAGLALFGALEGERRAC